MNWRSLIGAGATVFSSGCMMAGMGHSGGAAPPSEAEESRVSPTATRVVVGDVRMIVDLAPPAAGDPMIVTVTLAGPDPASVRDADLTLTIVPVPAPSPSGDDRSVAQARDRAFGAMTLTPIENGDGSYVFRPLLPRDGPARLTVVLRRIGGRTFEPPIEVEQIWSMASAARATGPHTAAGPGLTPLLLLGAGLMAVMMFFSFR